MINSSLETPFEILVNIFKESIDSSLNDDNRIQQELEQQVSIIRIITDDKDIILNLKNLINKIKDNSIMTQAIILGKLAVLSTTNDVKSFNKAHFCGFISKYIVESLLVEELVFKKIIKTIYELEK